MLTLCHQRPRFPDWRAGEATWTALLTWDLLERDVRKAEASAGTSLPHLAAVPRLEICPGCHGEQGESANESLESEHGSTPAKIPCSSDGLGGGGGAEVPAAGAFSAGSPLSMKWFGGGNGKISGSTKTSPPKQKWRVGGSGRKEKRSTPGRCTGATWIRAVRPSRRVDSTTCVGGTAAAARSPAPSGTSVCVCTVQEDARRAHSHTLAAAERRGKRGVDYGVSSHPARRGGADGGHLLCGSRTAQGPEGERRSAVIFFVHCYLYFKNFSLQTHENFYMLLSGIQSRIDTSSISSDLLEQPNWIVVIVAPTSLIRYLHTSQVESEGDPSRKSSSSITSLDDLGIRSSMGSAFLFPSSSAPQSTFLLPPK